MAKKKSRAVFLDRDGTILNERGYLGDPGKMKFYSSAFRGLKLLQKMKFKLVVISNQSGVARGLFTLADLKKVNVAFKARLAKKGIRLAGIYYCPHSPTAGCSCRKPRAGMAIRAARDLQLDLTSSYVIGDQKGDMDLARRIKAKGLLVLTGAGAAYRGVAKKFGSTITKNLVTAARWIKKQEAL